jgi:hypothetical protein
MNNTEYFGKFEAWLYQLLPPSTNIERGGISGVKVSSFVEKDRNSARFNTISIVR